MRLVWILAGFLAACATQQTTMVPIAGPGDPRSQSEVRQVEAGSIYVRVLDYSGGDIFPFEVRNLTAQPFVLDRDAVEVQKPDGTKRTRLPGGSANAYSVPAGGVQRVNVRFDVSDVLPGDFVRVDFSPAVQLLGGAKASLPALVIKYH